MTFWLFFFLHFLQVITCGRTFRVGCVAPEEESSWSTKLNFLPALVAAGGGFLLLLVVVLAVCFVRHKKRQFQRRFQKQHSVASGQTLVSSESAGKWKHSLNSAPTFPNTRTCARARAYSHTQNTNAQTHTHRRARVRIQTHAKIPPYDEHNSKAKITIRKRERGRERERGSHS